MFILASGVPAQRSDTTFDPRQPQHREPTREQQTTAIKQLLTIYPDACIAHLWGIDPMPPEPAVTVDVETTISLENQARQLILHPG